jgi:hypothetical protein
MNAIAMAMKDAGVVIPPLIKRVWLWIKDHPESTYKEVANALGEKPNNVSSTLGILVLRGMANNKKHLNRNGVYTNYYSAVGYAYELLPLPKKIKQELPEATVATSYVVPKVTTTPLVGTYDSIPKPFNPEEFTDNLTMSQARSVYTYLKGMFA